MLTVSILYAIIICYVIPIGGLILLWRRKKGAAAAFGAGVLSFTISQIVIRIPILSQVLPDYAWFGVLQLKPWAYGLFLGLTAGVFEEGARWIAMKFFLKGKYDLEHGLAFGLGHGGIEAMVLIGWNYIVILVNMASGLSPLYQGLEAGFFMGGTERLFAMAFHVGASLLVMYGVRERKSLRYLAAAILLHTLVDAAIVILPSAFGIGSVGLEVYIAVVGTATLAGGLVLLCRRREERAAGKELE